MNRYCEPLSTSLRNEVEAIQEIKRLTGLPRLFDAYGSLNTLSFTSIIALSTASPKQDDTFNAVIMIHTLF